MQFTPSWPSDAALDCLDGQMSALRKGDLVDGVSTAVSCLGIDPDEARDLLAGIWWDRCSLSECPEHIRVHELSQRLKHGSFTLRDPSWVIPGKGRSLEGKFHRFWERHDVQITLRSAEYADAQLRKWIRRGSLRAVSALDAAVSFDHKSARGLPWMMTTPHAPLCYLNEAEALLADGLKLEHARSYPGVGGTRGQAQGAGQKASWRAIFGMSLVTNILKKMLFIPLSSALCGTTKFCAWQSREAVDLAVTRILKSAPLEVLSIDFSNFDASIPDDVLIRMFNVLSFWFQGSDGQLVRFCRESFLRTGLHSPSGYLPGLEKRGGVPSGSVLTNLIDSMVNFWAVTYAAHRLGAEVNHYLLQGDDGVYTFNRKVDFSCVSDILAVELGMVMSPNKCHISDREVVYLQSTHSLDHQDVNGVCVGVRPIMRFLNGYMKPFSQETDPTWGPVLTAIRTLQQLDNCSGHPCFEQALVVAWEHDYENLYDAIVRLCNNDRALADRATVVRTLRAGGVSTTVGDLYRSPCVLALRALYPKVFSA